MIRTNRERLVVMSVLGEVVSPIFRKMPYNISPEGEAVVLPGVGGITYNVRIGDKAVGWEGDHVEPGVSIKNLEKGEGKSANTALNILCCVGNEARMVSGEAKGERGVVTGKHGGIEHVLVDFEPEILKTLVIGDKVMVRACGLGLKLLDCADVRVMNIDPGLLEKIPLACEDGVLSVPVTQAIPAAAMGSGIGTSHAYSGDYDMQLADTTVIEEHGLEDVRLGDLVALMDADHTYGRVYRKGAVSIGVVVHCDCVVSGHGPGVMTVLTSSQGKILPSIDPEANVANYIGIR
ncbi:MAG: DUF4438 domain-containing protein [Gemmatimonadota bacterium]|nr:MAG: DUF4438 domain-containing protein [Gemmatimonadota bacterium]